MQVEFLSKFLKDLDYINQEKVRKATLKVIAQSESTNSLAEIRNCKKLSGFNDAYRIRIGDFRIGIFVKGNMIQFARLVHRKDVYKAFP